MNHDEIENLNRTITRKKIGSVTKNLPKNKNQGPNSFTGESYQTVKEELMPILPKLIQKIAEEGTLPNSFYKASTTLIPNQIKTLQRKKISYSR